MTDLELLRLKNERDRLRECLRWASAALFIWSQGHRPQPLLIRTILGQCRAILRTSDKLELAEHGLKELREENAHE